MSVAVAQHMPHAASSSQVSMESKSIGIKSEDIPTSDVAKGTSSQDAGPVRSTRSNATESKTTNDPLAPPPRPTQTQQNGGENGDYFGQPSNTHFSREPNPFEQSFGVSSTDTPNSKSLLPPVASLTSPAPLGGESASGGGGYSFQNSLRSGPLSPAMLGGPVGASDYFDPSLRGTTFPSGVTPNESSLRTGLTPGGGGSMFPAPSPNSQALYQQLASGGATPNTLDFHRTAINAAAAQKGSNFRQNSTSTTQAADEKRAPVAPMDPALQNTQSTFGQHDNDAANGLFMLAQATGSQSNNQFAVPNPANAPSQQARSSETSPTMTQAIRNGSLGASNPARSEISGEVSDSGDQGKPATRSKGKRTSSGKSGASTNGRRKAEETPVKLPPSKKSKISAMPEDDDMDSDDDPNNFKEETHDENGRKMTDEEKRKNFLERNRVAALKCRQRKKQWLANLQAKVELFSSENDTLSAQVATLREEIVGLKTLLLQHKDCPVSQSQGLGPFFAQQEFSSHTNPYGMGIQNGQQVMAGQRR